MFASLWPNNAHLQLRKLSVFDSLASNHANNADSKKRRAFVAPFFTAGYGER